MDQDNKPTLVQRPAGYDKLVPKGYKNVAKDKVYKKLDDITKTDVATFISEMTPVIGDAIAAKEVYDEIQKDDPNWLLIGALGGATIVGAVPFVGDAASKLINKGARQALDVAKRIEVNPNAINPIGSTIKKVEYDYDTTLNMENIIDEWASGDISNEILRKKLSDMDIKIGRNITKNANPSTLKIEMPDGNIYYGTHNVPSTKPIAPQEVEMMGNGYAVGGVVEGQTEMAFADGGLPVDPVSGNEVPPGSLPEEVRDDIKVGVSEGEYIVPADVLRYYGMKFFEDLRAEAKVALGGMEQDGRMGGEPMMEGPMEEEDDLPFSTEELISEDQMSEGGYMRGYAVGGITTPEAAASAYPDTQMADIFGTSGNTGGIQYVTYYGPNGETITIQTFNGSPMTPVPSGYTTTPPVAAAEDVAPPTEPTNQGDNNDRQSGKTAEEMAADLAGRFEGTDWDNLSTDIMGSISGLDKDKEGWKSLIPGFSFAQKLNRVAEVGTINAKIGVLELQGDAAGAKAARAALEAQMKAAGINIPPGLGTGSQYLGGITRTDTGFIDPTTGKPRTPTATVTANTPAAVEPTSSERNLGSTGGSKSDSNKDRAAAQDRQSASNVASEAAAEAAQSSNAQQGNLSSGQSNAGSTTVTAERRATESAEYGALNKGGLMTKKKKK